MTLVDFTSPFIDAGTGTHGAIVVGRDKSQPLAMQRIIGQMLAVRSLNALVASLGLAFFVWFFHRDYVTGVAAVSFLIISSAIDSQYVQLGSQRLWQLGLWNSLGKLLVVLPMFWLVRDTGDAIIFAVLMTASNSWFSLCTFVDAMRRWRPCLPSFDDLKAVYRTILPFSVLIVLLFVHEKFDFFLIEAFLSKVEVGLYGGMSRIFLSLQALLPALTAAFGSEMLSARDSEAFSRQLEAALAAIALFVAPITVGSWFVGGQLLQVFFDASYAATALPFAVLCTSMLFFAPAFVFGIHALLTLGRVRLVSAAYLLGVSVGVVTGLLAIPRWGMLGGAIAVLTAKMALAAVLMPAGLTLVDRRRVLRITLPSIIAALLMGGVLSLLQGASFWTSLILGGSVYVVMAVLANWSWLRAYRAARRELNKKIT